MAQPDLAFGPYVLERSRDVLLLDGKPVAIGRRALRLLRALIEAEGRIVGKAELLELAWPGAIVEEGNLTVQIAALRKALGTTPDGEQWITTVPRVGYFLPRAVAAAVQTSIPSVAVLPFANMSSDPEQDYFADGIVEDIITALSRFKSFAVVARNSSFVYKGSSVDVREVAKALGVRYVLEGSVRRAGDRLRISAQLIEGASGNHLWAHHFDGAVPDVFDVQDRITEGVAAVVEPKILQAEIERSRRDRPESLDAYDLYLRAQPKIGTERAEDNAAAIELLERAIALDPEYALAIAVAAECFEHRVTMGWPPVSANDRQRSLELADRALARAGDDASVLALCGIVLVMGRSYDRGLQTLKRALEANPNHVVLLNCAGIGHLIAGSLEDALSIFHRALRLSPGDPNAYFYLSGLAHAHMALGRYEEALDWARRSISVNANFDPTHWMLIAANAHLGRLDGAGQALSAYRANVPKATLSSVRSGQHAKDPRRIEVVIEGLRAAGMPEG